MSFYKNCADCGANLDPCERCDCQREENKVTINLVIKKRKELKREKASRVV